MKKNLFLLFLMIASLSQAQYSIKGTMSTPHENNWVILYKIEGAKQIYIDNMNVKKDTVFVDGVKKLIANFEFELPEKSQKGSYRATYALKGAGFIDFLFNNEDISFTFNPE